ncbi:cytochrome d ubiquinol oxidase subunit II [Desulfocurvibacter africanus]|uniref:cytochrome d ubiquinol oxidase subunit II n=1 Tax=Desulfocurvibacter africanus TaxID=873 RepID=UPI00040B843F|nr:cytochrome d ubiquinol oxidase subunit II [Desulfocurvibacter africanus]
MDLQAIWFFLWGLLWAVFFMLDGYDLGAGALMPVLAKNERDRRMILNASGPFWDGNEVWLITAGGATFAAFPAAYAAMFSGLYTALMLLLFMLILRGVSFEFRGKVESAAWQRTWDWLHVVSSFVVALLLGVAFANIFRGLPLDEQGIFQGGLLTLLNPYGLAGGVLFVVMFFLHGALWLGLRTDGELQKRSQAMAEKLWIAFAIVLVLFLAYTAVETQLFSNYLRWPVLLIVPLLAVIGLIATRTFLGSRRMWPAMGASALTIVAVTFFGIIGLFPALLPSRLNPGWSVTAYNSSSSELTLTIMLVVVGIFVPIVIAYQTWAHIMFAKPMGDEDLDHEEAY